MAAYPSPITTENFHKAWNCITRKRRWAIKKELIRRVSVSMAQIVYFFVFLVLTIGALYEMGGPFVRRYMDQLSQIGRWWNQISEPLLADATTETMRLLRCAQLLYLFPFGIVLPPVILIVLFYRPHTPKRTGDIKQDAWQLQGFAKHAQIYARKQENQSGKFYAIFMGVLMALFLLGLMLFARKNWSLSDEIANRAGLYCFLYGLALFLCYQIASIPLRIMLKLLHFCYVPASMVTDTKNFYEQIAKEESTPTNNKGDA